MIDTELELQYPIISKMEVKTDLIITDKIAEDLLLPLNKDGKQFKLPCNFQKKYLGLNNSIFFDFEAFQNLSHSFFHSALKFHSFNAATVVSSEEEKQSVSQILEKLNAKIVKFVHIL